MAEILTNIKDWGYFTEDEMQKEVDLYLKEIKFYRQGIRSHRWYREELHPHFFREVRVPEVGRISDHIIFFSKRKIVNVECKKENYIEVVQQAKDHLRWADYSMVCLPVGLYMPNYIKNDMITAGIGLLHYFPHQGIYQTINPKHNRNKEETLREPIVKRLEGLASDLKLAI